MSRRERKGGTSLDGKRMRGSWSPKRTKMWRSVLQLLFRHSLLVGAHIRVVISSFIHFPGPLSLPPSLPLSISLPISLPISSRLSIPKRVWLRSGSTASASTPCASESGGAPPAGPQGRGESEGRAHRRGRRSANARGNYQHVWRVHRRSGATRAADSPATPSAPSKAKAAGPRPSACGGKEESPQSSQRVSQPSGSAAERAAATESVVQSGANGPCGRRGVLCSAPSAEEESAARGGDGAVQPDKAAALGGSLCRAVSIRVTLSSAPPPRELHSVFVCAACEAREADKGGMKGSCTDRRNESNRGQDSGRDGQRGRERIPRVAPTPSSSPLHNSEPEGFTSLRPGLLRCGRPAGAAPNSSASTAPPRARGAPSRQQVPPRDTRCSRQARDVSPEASAGPPLSVRPCPPRPTLAPAAPLSPAADPPRPIAAHCDPSRTPPVGSPARVPLRGTCVRARRSPHDSARPPPPPLRSAADSRADACTQHAEPSAEIHCSRAPFRCTADRIPLRAYSKESWRRNLRTSPHQRSVDGNRS